MEIATFLSRQWLSQHVAMRSMTMHIGEKADELRARRSCTGVIVHHHLLQVQWCRRPSTHTVAQLRCRTVGMSNSTPLAIGPAISAIIGAW